MTDPETLTPREAWQRYLNGRRTEITEESASSYHYRLKLFVEWCEANGVDAVSELDGWTLDRYESHRAGEGIARHRRGMSRTDQPLGSSRTGQTMGWD